MSPALRAALALALMLGFYVLAIGSGAGLIWLAVAMMTSDHPAGLAKPAFLAAVAGGTVLLSLRPRFDKFEAPGPRLERESQPELFQVIDDVARVTEQAVPSEVYAVPDVNAWVMTRGGVLGLGGRRVMGLGVPLLHLLTVDQLKAVLAHEFGHYGGGDTRIGRLVYHTRLGLGRTLAAVEGKTIEILFSWYGHLVMRVSTAVARQQEFAADRFAARTTSGQDLSDALRRTDQHGALFPLFLAGNLSPVVEEGYWAPVGSGFAVFCALPIFAPAALTEGSPPADGPASDLSAHDATFDSHPPTTARIAALNALGPEPDRAGDRRTAGTLLRESGAIEYELYRPGVEQPATLKPVEWGDVTSRVLVPRWQRIAVQRAQLLKHVKIEAPPATQRDIVELGRVHAGMKGDMTEDVIERVLFAIACGVMMRLIEKGWTAVESPSLVAELVRGDERVEPFGAIYAVGVGNTPVDAWAAFCAKEGLSGPLA